MTEIYILLSMNMHFIYRVECTDKRMEGKGDDGDYGRDIESSLAPSPSWAILTLWEDRAVRQGIQTLLGHKHHLG